LGLCGIIVAELLTLVIPFFGNFGSPTLTQQFIVLAPLLGTAGYYLGHRKPVRAA
jgi:hypothetical protein